MCYASPAPRCSTHALADMKKAQVALDQASVNLEKARVVGKTTQTALREAKLRNAEAELEVAKAAYGVAFRAYEKAKEEKAAAYKFFKAEKEEYHLSTKGIQKLRDEGKGELADRFAAERKYRVAKAKAQEAKEQGKSAKPLPEPPIDEKTQQFIDDIDTWGRTYAWEQKHDRRSNERGHPLETMKARGELIIKPETHPALIRKILALSQRSGARGMTQLEYFYIMNAPSINQKTQLMLARKRPLQSRELVQRDDTTMMTKCVVARVTPDPWIGKPLHPLIHHAMLEGNEDTIKFAIRDEATTPEQLAFHAGDPNHEIRRSVASNPKTPVETQILLAGDRYSLVRLSLLDKPEVDKRVIDILLKDDDDDEYEVKYWAEVWVKEHAK